MKNIFTLKRSAGMVLALSVFGGQAMTATAAPENLLLNSGFEEPAGTPTGLSFFNDADFPGWQTTDVQSKFEVWPKPAPVAGNAQFIELNAYSAGTVYQDFATTPCAVVTWSVEHSARLPGTDVMNVSAGLAGGNANEGLTILSATTKNGAAIDPTTELSDTIATEGDDTAWGTWTGTFVVPEGQTTTRIAFSAVSSASGSITAGNFLDNVSATEVAGECPGEETVEEEVVDKEVLADTGSDTLPLTFGAAVVMALGAALVLISRRRKA